MPSGRTIEKGFVISPQIAGIFLVALLGMAGWAYKSSTADSRETRDSIIRMETMLNERTRTFEREQDKAAAELKDEIKLASMYRENENKKRTEMIYALRQKGIVISE